MADNLEQLNIVDNDKLRRIVGGHHRPQQGIDSWYGRVWVIYEKDFDPAFDQPGSLSLHANHLFGVKLTSPEQVGAHLSLPVMERCISSRACISTDTNTTLLPLSAALSLTSQAHAVFPVPGRAPRKINFPRRKPPKAALIWAERDVNAWLRPW